MEDEYGFEALPDRELINAPINSELGKKYYKAINAKKDINLLNHFNANENITKLKNKLKFVKPQKIINKAN